MKMTVGMRIAWIATLALGPGPARAQDAPDGALPLAGEWRCTLDSTNAGIAQMWFGNDLASNAVIRLPGTTDEAGLGDKIDFPPKTRAQVDPKKDYLTWSRKYAFVGPVWYQREVDIPESWRGRRGQLVLERCQWESRAWLDSHAANRQDSLSAPHIHDLGLLVPGRHRLTVRVDNTVKYDLGNAWAGWANSISGQNQPNWNGILGRIALEAVPQVSIEDAQVYPDAARKTAKVSIVFGNDTGGAIEALLRLRVHGVNDAASGAMKEVRCVIRNGTDAFECELPLGSDAKPWDEFAPTLYEAQMDLSAPAGKADYVSSRKITFGLRALSITPEKMFALNGRTLYLRGTVENGVFPLTGHPPTDEAAWTRIFTICRAHGLNHMRFHSWCPPGAAFAAADRAGFLLQVDAPVWIHDWGTQPARDRWVGLEVQRILRAYGNHPSFAMLSMGNEPAGDLSIPDSFTRNVKRQDPRVLCVRGSGWGPAPYDDFDLRGGPVPWQHVDGLRGSGGPATDWDHAAVIAQSRLPLLTHELGRYAVYPRMAEIAKYTGAMRVRNLELIRDDLAARQMLDQAAAFTTASGKLAALLYKADVEGVRRTPGHAGFQLLGLSDCPGQGTSLVGMLDPFWESKDLITPEEYNRFAGPTVVLARLPGRVFNLGDTVRVKVDVAHFGAADMAHRELGWSLTDGKDVTVASGRLPFIDLPTGKISRAGVFEMFLRYITVPGKCTLKVGIRESDVYNSWNIWIYPPAPERAEASPTNVVVAAAWNAQARDALAAGGRVLLLANGARLARTVPVAFGPVTWNPVLSGDGEGTMGLLCDPKHPALADFPTEMHTDWQWYELLDNARAALLDDAPPAYRPVVQAVDNFVRNRRLGVLFEARIGTGRLLVCTLDVSGDLDRRPAARQLRHSLFSYVSGNRFDPLYELSVADLDRILAER